jgi:hypothetical protein
MMFIPNLIKAVIGLDVTRQIEAWTSLSLCNAEIGSKEKMPL